MSRIGLHRGLLYSQQEFLCATFEKRKFKRLATITALFTSDARGTRTGVKFTHLRLHRKSRRLGMNGDRLISYFVPLFHVQVCRSKIIKMKEAIKTEVPGEMASAPVYVELGTKDQAPVANQPIHAWTIIRDNVVMRGKALIQVGCLILVAAKSPKNSRGRDCPDFKVNTRLAVCLLEMKCRRIVEQDDPRDKIVIWLIP